MTDKNSKANPAQQSPAPDPRQKNLSSHLTGSAAAGPLVVSKANPRYFTVASGSAADQKVVYLTGSHIWNNFHDGVGPGMSCAETPQPWPRTGPGTATDGKPEFDLSRFDQAYFDRLRDRVIAAGKEGIYVAVMLFDGFALHLRPAPDNVDGPPFYPPHNSHE